MRALPAAPALLRPSRRSLTYTALLLALGVAVTLPWTVRERVPPPSREAQRESALQSIGQLEDEQRALKARLADLRARLADVQHQQASARAASAGLDDALKGQRILAGLTPLVGPGVVVTLSDSAATAPVGSAASDYIVHDTDVRDILNALWAAEADAIAVNGERLVATTSVVCVGTVIIINDTRLSPPYVVTGLGDPTRLTAALESAPELAPLRKRVKEVGLLLKVSPGETLETPAYRGTLAPRPATGV